MALSRWPLPWRAAVRRAEPLPLGETEAERCCWERREGRLRSVGREGVCEPAGKAGGEVGEAGVGVGGIVLYRRVVVRQGAVGASARSGYAGGLNDDRRLVGAVVGVAVDVGRIDVLRGPATADVPEDGAAAAGLLVFWSLWDDGGGRGRGGRGAAGGVDHRLGAVAVGLEELGQLGARAGARRRSRGGR